MRILSSLCLWVAATLVTPASLAAQEPARQVQELQRMLQELKADYESRIGQLEQRLREMEQAVAEAREQAEEAEDAAESVATRPIQRSTSPNQFNPAIGAVLVGSYQALDVGGEDYAIPGFILGPETGPGEPGFSLGESEINFNANIDDKFYGDLTFALHDHAGATEVELEEAYIQTLALPAGLKLTAGRFFSDIGYRNSFHLHADDFTDRPLPYQAFLGNQYKDDGVQLSWLAPTPLYLEMGAEVFDGDRFPAAAAPSEGAGAWSVFAHTGGDFGISHSWRAGLSYLHAEADAPPEHEHEHEAANAPEEALVFSGDRDLWIADFVYKWAPNGNPRQRNFKLQGEYFLREEEGAFGEASYEGEQTGWYLLGSYQFDPQWRFGYRYDRLDADNIGAAVPGTLLDPLGLTPERHSLVLEWFNSEFSRVRLQYSRDESTAVGDNQLFLQYIMSLGAHGAHKF